jgi:hypothetical protein
MKAVVAVALVALAGPSIHVTPSAVHRGHVVRVHGAVGRGCARGDTVTLISRAFSHRHDFAGLPAIYALARSDGTYSKRTRIPRRRAPGRYRISGRCGGGNLGVSAHIRVRR